MVSNGASTCVKKVPKVRRVKCLINQVSAVILSLSIASCPVHVFVCPVHVFCLKSRISIMLHIFSYMLTKYSRISCFPFFFTAFGIILIITCTWSMLRCVQNTTIEWILTKHVEIWCWTCWKSAEIALHVRVHYVHARVCKTSVQEWIILKCKGMMQNP